MEFEEDLQVLFLVKAVLARYELVVKSSLISYQPNSVDSRLIIAAVIVFLH
jgi:hypothetical protein